MTCNCANDWRLEVLDLSTGQRRTYLQEASFDAEEILNQIGTASVIAPLEKVRLPDVFPHRAAIAFTRTAGPGASPSTPVAEFIGMVESVNADTAAGVTIGLVSIEGYLRHRLMADGTYTDAGSTLGANAVNAVSTDGIQLSGVDDGGSAGQSIVNESGSDTVTWDFIERLTNIEDGPDYHLLHVRNGNGWRTEMHFGTYADPATPRLLNAKRGLTTYGVTVDATDHANWIRVRDQDNLSASTSDPDTIYPKFDRSIKYAELVDSGGSLIAALNGDIARYKDPIAVPDVTIADLDISGRISVGDTIALDMDYGALRFKGTARVLGKAWSVSPDSPTLCTLSLVSVDPVDQTILHAPKGLGRGCC